MDGWISLVGSIVLKLLKFIDWSSTLEQSGVSKLALLVLFEGPDELM